MRVAVLGAGAMGARAARTLAGLHGVDSLIVADRDPDAAVAVAAALPCATAQRVDVTNAAGLRAALADVDTVLTTVGPFYRFGTAVLRAAIDTGTDYVDICDDWEPTLELLELDGAARAAGVCAVIGAGASPGLSTLLASAAAARLHRLRDLHTAWSVDTTAPRTAADTAMAGAAGVHWMHQCSGEVAEVAGGAVVRRAPLRPVALRLPGGRRGTGWTVGHPEPVTLHRTAAPSGESACLMLLRPGTVAYLDVLRRDIDADRLTPDDAAALLDPPSRWRALRSVPGAFIRPGPGDLPAFFAAADGTVDGRPVRVCARLETDGALLHDMAAVTGVPAALATAQLPAVRRPGVHPPDALLDGPRLFADLAVAFPGTRVIIEEEAGWLTD
ncbi:saccharopine dehydrogenase family protein [Tsukamurella paurometabola]|uniref:Glutamyl-tRNA reductase n=1 Tax=Tsukamurella paurometabola TaxID=2061 RepID=A0A3P8MB54_TSUPA|nr:saccharopine dehydrogenase NADP-binding domain-containing protein [Tsukamurella paurometabola]UEA81963.1 saccharopine dehydrogenase NADP-binding domain-containing protein [Tsukamurella paurometabola]VDR38990.1 glutamyl-tRNA reductase [Tsukamurella paurometabola]